MRLYESTPVNATLGEPDTTSLVASQAGITPTDLFTITCNRMMADMEWLKEEPRAESILLLRYFADRVRRIKDLPDYREILWECLAAVNCEGCAVQTFSDLEFTPNFSDQEDCA